ncbi:MAG: SusC/RagA family TonB-linked outer membrane protein [Mucilaginibacter polytrichastri]|nr:SusC/RagA family TonB-linked outer membrane protein [Mucilaginibacter polytrichastri]
MKIKRVLCVCICLAFLWRDAVQAQTKKLSGKVVDEKHLPVVGASVKLLNGGGVATDANGAFTLDYSGEATLIISAIGYATQQVKLGDKTKITITLAEDSKQLSEVVVTALGVRREKRNLTYSTQELKSEELVQAKEPNLVNAVAGKVSGVQITSSSGTPGASSRIVIRGATSVYGDNQPLMVIDGVPVNNDETGTLNAGPGTNRLADIDPSIIESINVLKGAAATALYGSEGARGVLMITTKNGAPDKKPTINFSSDYSFENPLVPEIQNKYAQGNRGVYIDGEEAKTSTSWGPLMDTLRINGQPAPRYNQSDLFFKTGQTFNNTVSINGGHDQSSYFLSYSNFAQNGTVPGTKFDRNTIFGKFTSKIADKLNATFQLNYTNSANDKQPEGYVLESPLWTIFSAPISYNLLPATNPDGSQRLFRFSRNNPYWVLDNIYNQSNVNRFLPTITLNYNPLKWLTITERVGLDTYTEIDKYKESVGSAANPTGRLVDQTIAFRQLNQDLIVNANQTFGDFDMNFLLGNNIRSTTTAYNYANGVGLSVDGFDNMASASTVTYNQTQYRQRKIGFYAQANVDYKKFLILSLTGRYDGSSVLATDKNFYPYGSAATSFIFSEFLPGASNWMNLGKVRMSFATTGNDGVGPYSLFTPYEKQTIGNINFPFQGQSGFLLSSTLGNPVLTNERLNEFEAGLEMGFFKNRINFEFSYFRKFTHNGLIPGVAIAPSSGYSGTTVNSAEMTNRGFELLLNGAPVRNENFGWDITLNFSRIRNNVVSLYQDLQQLGNGFTNLIVGQSYGVIYGTKFARNAAGQLLTDDTGLPFNDGQGIIGNINPDWLAGINNSFRYKGFNFSFFFDYKHGGDIQNNVDGYGYFYGTPKVTEDRGPRVVEGINANTGQPNTVSVEGQDYYQRINGVLESVIQDGTYLKLRNVSLGYTLNPKFLVKTPFKAANFSVTGRNLWIYSPHFTGADPEVSSFGSSNGSQGIYSFSTPTSRSFNFALKLTF